MKTAAVISVENLGKRYTLHHQQREEYTALRDVITKGFASLGNKLIHPFRRSLTACNSPLTPSVEDFWALQDVSFEVNQGDRIGIIGRNGAGKSTLLKILSRITEPTTGSIRIKGRVASLLEVGTGFHPELTGRENIFLNGAILGMYREEILRKFDEIVDFSEIEKFLDTPVKRYSSGMYVRLAFAVAAHLEPEILIVDEVLAVGDAQFQKKCLGKMEDVGREGRTVLFVSHNIAAISFLCQKSILLEQGMLNMIGSTSNVIEKYQLSLNKISNIDLSERKDRNGNGKARILGVFFVDKNNNPINVVFSGDECKLVINYESKIELCKPVMKFTIYTVHSQPIIHCDSSATSNNLMKMGKYGSLCCLFPKIPLTSGCYTMNVSIELNCELLDHVSVAYSFSVADGDYFGTGRVVSGLKETCLVQHQWNLQ